MTMMAYDTTNISESEYARKQKEIFAVVKELKALGADLDMGIPQLVVIGGQSAGKSSLVEAVTGINVPRDSGTCTRCPMECTIEASSDNTWSCQVSLRRSTRDLSGSLEYGTTHELQFSPLLLSKNDVEIWLRRAQTAILSPHVSETTFKDMDYEQLKDHTESDPHILKFSKDIVVVDIQDPEGMALSFVDVPGLIQNEEDEIINVVQTLVEEQIQPENAIILVTIPASDDLENQQAASQGVVTKPDTLTRGASGARKKWLDIIQGRAHKLHHGYYVVKLPEDDERAKNLSRQDLTQRAWKFFSETEPWRTLLRSRRLGIPNLISDLSELLMKITQESLPGLKEEVENRLAECSYQIDALPEEIRTDPTSEILGRISGFCTELQGEVYGHNEDKSFVHQNRASFKEFKLKIRETAPDFRPVVDSTQSSAAPEYEYDRLDLDIPRPVTYCLPPMDLRAVRLVIEESTGWELPHHIPYEATRRLIQRSINLWKTPSHTCFDQISYILNTSVNDKIAKHFGQFPLLEQHLGSMIRNEIAEFARHARRAMVDVLEREDSPYLTQNNHDYESARENWLKEYKKKFRRADEIPARTSASFADIAVEEPRLRADDYEEEIVVMADVCAYFQVAYKRIIDHVPMTIQRDLNQLTADGIQKRLVANLRLTDPDSSQRLYDLCAEDPAVKADRERLGNNWTQLESFKAMLDNFMH
ncbi:nucleoside triphosphate hydrolase protein [Wolfiporia cocos MD-104 SS10]|uniref:Nucleoside triphosphate hydrolase protein n=1 Tax=Wolfiporia cocos (strain MD-104) TaxID=742152 RepID=A0A2H3J756_WOLCO|nr:nucleoside triphosphate hydrolase protein [Wolfiporia cocos MD-104 SS10]